MQARKKTTENVQEFTGQNLDDAAFPWVVFPDPASIFIFHTGFVSRIKLNFLLKHVILLRQA